MHRPPLLCTTGVLAGSGIEPGSSGSEKKKIILQISPPIDIKWCMPVQCDAHCTGIEQVHCQTDLYYEYLFRTDAAPSFLFSKISQGCKFDLTLITVHTFSANCVLCKNTGFRGVALLQYLYIRLLLILYYLYYIYIILRK